LPVFHEIWGNTFQVLEGCHLWVEPYGAGRMEEKEVGATTIPDNFKSKFVIAPMNAMDISYGATPVMFLRAMPEINYSLSILDVLARKLWVAHLNSVRINLSKEILLMCLNVNRFFSCSLKR
jgi:hypothetical protein